MNSLTQDTTASTICTALVSVAEAVTADATPEVADIKDVATKEAEETVADAAIKAVVPVGMVETNHIITTTEIGTTTTTMIRTIHTTTTATTTMAIGIITTTMVTIMQSKTVLRMD